MIRTGPFDLIKIYIWLVVLKTTNKSKSDRSAPGQGPLGVPIGGMNVNGPAF
jgi:hypothetical protein